MIVAIDGPNDFENLEMARAAMDRFNERRVTLNEVNWANRKQFINALGSKNYHFLAGNTWLTSATLSEQEKVWWYERLLKGRGRSFIVMPMLRLVEEASRLGVTVDPTIDQVVLETLMHPLNHDFPKHIGNPEATDNLLVSYPNRSHMWSSDTIHFMSRFSEPRQALKYGFTYVYER